MYDKDKWYKNRDRINARRRKRYAVRKQEGWKENRNRVNKNNRAYVKRMREKIIHILGQNECQMCLESDPIVLQLDHINGGGTKEHRILGKGARIYVHYIKHPELIKNTFQVLCANCHLRKHSRQPP